MAAFGFSIAVSGAALIANIERSCREAATFLGPNARRQFGFVDSIGAPLVIDQAARAEFGNGDEASPLQIGTL